MTKALNLKKDITPRAMRRTFQDLARAAEVRDVVTRAVSGHATEAMQRHYSTVPQAEVREAIGRVVSLLDFKLARGGVCRPPRPQVVGKVVGTTRIRKRPARREPSNRPSFLSFPRAGEGIRTLDVHLGKRIAM